METGTLTLSENGLREEKNNNYFNGVSKALAEIYTMHSFAPFLESIIENWGKKNLAKTTPKRKKTRNREAIKQLAACHLEL